MTTSAEEKVMAGLEILHHDQPFRSLMLKEVLALGKPL